MKKFNFNILLFTSIVFGLSACSNADRETFDPLHPAIGALQEAAPNIWIEGPDSIQIGQEYTFTVRGETGTDAYYFQVQDTYFNESTSFSLRAGVPAATQVLITFHEYGHYKITATALYSNPPKRCAYEVAKYYDITKGRVEYDRTGDEYFNYNNVYQVISQWFQYYPGQAAQTFNGFEHRVVIKARQQPYLHTYFDRGRIDRRWGPDMGEITGTAQIGERKITLPTAERKFFPDSVNTPERYTVLEPYCVNEFTLPAARCGAL